MGKVKHMMRSLVKRLLPSKSSLASSPSSKSTGSDATGRDDRLAPNSTLPSRPHTPSTIASELSTIRLSFSCSQDESPIQNMLERRRQLAPTDPCQKSNSFSTSSFVCRSARRIERGNLVEEDSDNDTSSSGSLSGWGISTGGGLPFGHSHGDILVYQPSLPVGLVEQTGVMMSDDEFNALPEWSDVEDDPECNEYVQNQGDTWSVTTASSTDYDGQVTPLLAEFEVYIPTGCPPQIYLYRHQGRIVDVQNGEMKSGGENKKRGQDEDEEQLVVSKRRRVSEGF